MLRTRMTPALEQRHPRRFPPSLLALAATVFVGTAAAAGPTLAAGVAPLAGAWPALTVSAALPFAVVDSEEGPVEFAGRLDVSTLLDFPTPPSLAILGTATLTGHDWVDPYAGVGAALGWRGGAGAPSAFVTPVAVVGVRVPLGAVWAARIEGGFAPLVGTASFVVGIEVTPW